MEPPLILASASPRRRELLTARGFRFEVDPSNVVETPQSGESPDAFAQRIATEKAAEVARRHPGTCVLAADTVVALDGTLFGKPVDRSDARRMLRALSGRTHRVLTAVALVEPAGAVEEILVESQVAFRPLTATEIEEYLESGEPFDKAGAYAVQGLARKFVTRIRGSYSNVVGLPMEAVTDLLQRHLPCGASSAPVPP